MSPLIRHYFFAVIITTISCNLLRKDSEFFSFISIKKRISIKKTVSDVELDTLIDAEISTPPNQYIRSYS